VDAKGSRPGRAERADTVAFPRHGERPDGRGTGVLTLELLDR